jgi:hypothetical protein
MLANATMPVSSRRLVAYNHGVWESVNLMDLIVKLPKTASQPSYVESIVGHERSGTGRRQNIKFLVRWKGYGPEHDTLEPRKNLMGSELGPMVRAYKLENHLPLDKHDAKYQDDA